MVARRDRVHVHILPAMTRTGDLPGKRRLACPVVPACPCLPASRISAGCGVQPPGGSMGRFGHSARSFVAPSSKRRMHAWKIPPGSWSWS